MRNSKYPDLDVKLLEFAQNPTDAEINFELAIEYEKLQQWASAFSYFMRAAEFSDDDDLIYETLIKSSKMIRLQGRRKTTEECMLRHAISVYPQYREAYFLLAKFFHRQNNMRECKTMAEVALEKKEFGRFRTNVEYPGYACVAFEKAMGDWSTGMYEKARSALYDLKYHHELGLQDRKIIEETIEKTGQPDRVAFNKDQLWRFKHHFEGLEKIEKNYSKHMQDIFVLIATNGKHNGTYLEIGSADPFVNNNTYLLEKDFNWRGISIDVNKRACAKFYTKRKNQVICKNALDIDYYDLLESHNLPYDIDYLQIDADENSYEVLRRMPLHDYKFGVIHFEHDAYRFDNRYRDYSRQVLQEFGYVLVVDNLAYLDQYPHEDWWVHPDLIGEKKTESLISRRSLNQVVPYFYKMYSSFYEQNKQLRSKKK